MFLLFRCCGLSAFQSKKRTTYLGQNCQFYNKRLTVCREKSLAFLLLVSLKSHLRQILQILYCIASLVIIILCVHEGGKIFAYSSWLILVGHVSPNCLISNWPGWCTFHSKVNKAEICSWTRDIFNWKISESYCPIFLSCII